MKTRTVLVILVPILVAALAAAQTKTGGKVPDVLHFTMNNINGQPVDLSKYQGRVVMIVNTASECGYTYQYEALQALHRKYSGQGLSLLGFPSNDFGQQEPGNNDEIQEFCKARFGVEFDLFAKVEVLGKHKVRLFDYLTSSATNPSSAGEIAWNFEKFVIGRDGRILARFKSDIEPMSNEVTSVIEAALAKK